MTGPDDLQSNHVRVPMPSRLLGVEAYGCPVESCSWTKTVADVELETAHVPIRGSGLTLDDAISAAMVGRAKAMEKILRDHLESHDVVDFMRTICDLEQQLYNARHDIGVRPHRRTTEMPGHELGRIRDETQAEIVRRARGPHRVEDMTGEQRGRAAEAMQRYQEIDREPDIS